MGKSSQKRAAKRQSAENQRVTAQNNKRIAEQEKQNAELKKKQDAMNLETERKTYLTKSAMDAQKGVYDERTKAISDSRNLMTDFEAQEKRRLLKARTGSGQVDAEDTAITGEARQQALDTLNKGEDYWKNKAQVAYDNAYKGAEGKWTQDHTQAPAQAPAQATPSPTATATGKKGKGGKGGLRGIQSGPKTQRGNFMAPGGAWGRPNQDKKNKPGAPGKPGRK